MGVQQSWQVHAIFPQVILNENPGMANRAQSHGRSVADPLAEPSSFFPFTPQRGRLGLEPGLDAEF